jgi:hypothetical protein
MSSTVVGKVLRGRRAPAAFVGRVLKPSNGGKARINGWFEFGLRTFFKELSPIFRDAQKAWSA